MSTCVRSVRVPGSSALDVRVTEAATGASRCPRTVTCTGMPARTFGANACGTLTNTRSLSTCATSNRPLAAPVTLVGATAVLSVGLPAVIRAPTSTFRWMTVPPNGASTRWNDVICSSCRTLAWLDSTFASAAATAA